VYGVSFCILAPMFDHRSHLPPQSFELLCATNLTQLDVLVHHTTEPGNQVSNSNFGGGPQEAAVKHFFHDAMARRAAAARAAAAETDREARDRQRPTARFTGPGQMARAMRELMEDTRRQQGRLIHGHSVSAEPERLGTDAPRSLKLSPEQQAASVIKLYYAGARVIRSRSCDASGRRPETNPAGTTASNQNRSRSTIPAMWK